MITRHQDSPLSPPVGRSGRGGLRLNDDALIFATPSEIANVPDRLLHVENALIPMFVTLFGIVNAPVRPQLHLTESSPMLVMPWGMANEPESL